MAGPMDSADEAGLWRHWRAAAGDGSAADREPDALALAAYAEDRLDAETVAAVEAWLADNPQATRDVLAARQVRQHALPDAPVAIMARAAALVASGDAQVLAFRRPTVQVRHWRGAVGWGAMAASLLVASLAGFAMGNDTYATLAGSTNASLSQELLDPPTGLFNGVDEDSNI
jgi:anti-sigma factor RsiW